jgi:hypothetical protein
MANWILKVVRGYIMGKKMLVEYRFTMQQCRGSSLLRRSIDGVPGTVLLLVHIRRHDPRIARSHAGLHLIQITHGNSHHCSLLSMVLVSLARDFHTWPVRHVLSLNRCQPCFKPVGKMSLDGALLQSVRGNQPVHY